LRRSAFGTPFLFQEAALNDVNDRLWQLQQEMSQLQDLERRLATPPAGFSTLDESYQALAQQINKLSARKDELSEERRQLDGELADEQERLKKFQAQLMQVKNQQQYAAAWKEIDTARKRAKELEDQTLERMSLIEEHEQKLAELGEELAPIESERNAQYETWQASLGGIREEAATLREAISRTESRLSPALVREFRSIFKQRQGVAMARVESDSCGGCRVRVRPQVLQQLKRGELTRCEACRRIYYLDRSSSQVSAI
jgi:uncharacterized protein